MKNYGEDKPHSVKSTVTPETNNQEPRHSWETVRYQVLKLFIEPSNSVPVANLVTLDFSRPPLSEPQLSAALTAPSPALPTEHRSPWWAEQNDLGLLDLLRVWNSDMFITMNV